MILNEKCLWVKKAIIVKTTIIAIDSTMMKYPSNLYDFEGYFVAKLIAKSISYNPYIFATLGG